LPHLEDLLPHFEDFPRFEQKSHPYLRRRVSILADHQILSISTSINSTIQRDDNVTTDQLPTSSSSNIFVSPHHPSSKQMKTN